ncbi:PAS domain S-box protein [Halobellus sp. Atlit-38R]|uniref:PAS domain S-box protein n=1 Tax=Halobellus sp. Atlit-38R TaxID=2282131 RepID=UPI000EF28D2F|nr:PAS domain S-box protein [Halobellus sp. Atlit-38R]RLM83835.1 PAS domain S-box protein [Halobellus sp. Atlit-38R]
MSSAPSLAQVRDAFEALGPPGTPLTTPEVATTFDCTDRTIYNRLETLVEDGVLETKKVGARGRVWWQPVEEHRVTKREIVEKYRRLFESIEKGFCIIEVLFDDDDQPADYRFLETNPAFEKRTDLRDPEGKRIRELEPDHEDHWFEKYGAVAQTGEPVQFTGYAENLGERWYEIDAFRIGDPTDHTVAILFNEVSEHKYTENTVQGGEQRLKALVEATTEGVYRISPDWSEIYQLAGEGFVADGLLNTWQEYIPEDEQERVGQAIDEAIETQSPFELEHRIKYADGTVGWTHSKAVPILEDGEIVEWFGTATDITERKEQQREKDLLWQAIEKANSPLLMAEPGSDDNPIVYVNEAFEHLTGYTASELIGRDCRIFQGKSTRQEPVTELREAIDNEEQVTVELRNYQRDGTEFWNRVTISPVYDTDGELVRFLGTQEDITEYKEQERKRQEVVDRVTDGIIEVDSDWRCTFINGKGGELANTSEAELLDRTFWEVFEDARGSTFEKKYREVMDTREPASFVEYYPKLDSWFDVQAYPNDDDGVAIYFRDITERKEREQARQRAEKRYQKLLELAPVPIVAVDPGTEEVIEANDAAGELIGCPTAELIGQTRASLHPTEKNDGYDAIFRKATERGGTWRHLPDGSPTHIVDEHGKEIPVEITAKKVELEGDDVVYGVLQDITDQLEYQRRLDTLNEVTHELFDAEAEREVTRTAVEALADVLEITTVAFYSFDEDKWELGPAVHTTSSEEAEEIDELPVFEPGIGVEWRAFADGQTALVDDFRTRETDYEFERTIRSELAVPIDDWGLLVAADTRPDMFDDWTANLVETLGATIRSALDHTEREQELREQRRELQEIESLNQQIRDITHTIVQADSRVELEQSVCERLVASDAIEFAWIGNVDLEEKAVAPRAQAGTDSDYLDSVPLTLDESTDPEPSVQALQSRDACGSSNIATDIQHGEWRSTAIEREFRSVLSVPLIYREALYGALTVYSRSTSGFPDALRSVLQELCDLTAHASAAIEQKEALHTTQTTELEFEARDETTLFCRLAAVLDCEIELERVVSQRGESTLAFFSVANGTPEELLKEAKRLDGIEEGRLIERPNDTFIQLRITEPCIGSMLSNRGLILQQLVADRTRCWLTVEVPEAFNTRQAVNIVTSHYENAQLLAKRESDTPFNSRETSLNTPLGALTPRQREVVETAYRSGYFDSPRRVSGKEIAEMFDFSNSTFHEHIRKAEQTLFENLIEDTNRSLVT